MKNRTDAKLQRLAAAGLHPAGPRLDLVELGRRADITDVPAGTILRHEGGHEPWSYYVLRGSTLLSTEHEPVAIAGPGAWLFGHLPGRAHVASPFTAVAGDDVEVLAFRPGDAEVALRGLLLVGA